MVSNDYVFLQDSGKSLELAMQMLWKLVASLSNLPRLEITKGRKVLNMDVMM